ncbi:uncharacterized protein [Aegilops tauschii subsp. strangulata]|uniref:uncharacterized protein n=1 Tax=Aegilops tauschii subsp. strangulata TaxID=200361 RepID=UPI003CC8B5C7
MAAYRKNVTNNAGHFKGYKVDHIDRRLNEAADALSRLDSQHKPVPPIVFLDVLHNPSVKLPSESDLAIPDPEAQLVVALRAIPDWTVPYLAYLTRDAEDIVHTCDGCQKFARQAHVPAQELRMIPITWSFIDWGLDMVGPFKPSKDKKTRLLKPCYPATSVMILPELQPMSKQDPLLID